MGNDIKGLPSVYGYVNWVELRNVVLATNFIQLGLDNIVFPVLQHHAQWLNPSAEAVIGPVISIILALLAGREMGKARILRSE